HRPLAAPGSRLRKDIAAFPGASRSVRRRLRSRLVQADPPRYGPARPLSGPGSAERITALARPHSGGESRTGRCARYRLAQAEDPGVGAVRLAAGDDGLGIGVDLPWFGQAWRRQWRAHSPGAAEGLGGQPA